MLRRAPTLLALALLTACAHNKAPSTPPALDTTREAAAYAERIADADLVVHIEVTTRVNDRLPHHMAHAQLAFFNKTQRAIELPALDASVLEIEGPGGKLRTRAGSATAASSKVTLQPGEMLVGHVDLLETYEFPSDGGRFTVRFVDDERLPKALHLRANADYFVLGARDLY